MGEVIHIHLGQCGIQIGLNYWEAISEEHSIDASGNLHESNPKDRSINVSYEEVFEKRYVPRAIFMDLDPGSIDCVRGSSLGKLFRDDHLLKGRHGTGNNWAKGHYTDGAEMIDSLMDIVRAESEKCDFLQGYQITNSLGGGAGSGLGSLLVLKLREYDCSKVYQTFPVAPSSKVSDNVVEPYNAVLTLDKYIEYNDLTHMLDNEALYDITARNLVTGKPTYRDLNSLISRAMTGVTSTLRSPGQLNNSLSRMALNLLCFPRLHFLMTSCAPLGLKMMDESSSVPELVQQMFDSENMMCSLESKKGKYLSAFGIFRGNISTGEVAEEVSDLRNKEKSCFVEFIPDNMIIAMCGLPSRNINQDATLVANSTAIQQVFRRIQQNFNGLWRKKSFMHWYTSEGMDEFEFDQSISNLADLISEYNQYEHNRNWNEEEEDNDSILS